MHSTIMDHAGKHIHEHACMYIPVGDRSKFCKGATFQIVGKWTNEDAENKNKDAKYFNA